MEIQDNVGAVRDEKSVLGLDAALLELLELLKEAWDVNNASGTDEVDAGWVDESETGWDHVVVEGLALGDNGLETIKTNHGLVVWCMYTCPALFPPLVLSG